MNASGHAGRTERLFIDRLSIEKARQVLGDDIRTTPIITTPGADFNLACETVTFKLEQLQHAGSFKARGAFLNLRSRNVPAAGVVAASGGNHGAAVAYAAMQTRVRATIFVPTISAPAKIERIRDYGADLRVVGESYADALAASERWVADSGALMVHAFDQKETLLGQATVGFELEVQASNIDTILVPVGGGGLIAGVASWYSGRSRVVGVEPALAPTLTKAFEAGMPVDAPAGGIAADSLAPRRVGKTIFPILQTLVDRVVLVTDEEIRSAQQTLWNSLRVVAEPGGAAAFAGLLAGRYQPRSDEDVAVIVSGANARGEI